MVVTLDSVQFLRSKEPLKASIGIRLSSLFPIPPGRGIGSVEGTFAEVGKSGRRALFAFGILATALWAGASSADDSIERALSLVSQEKYAEARAVLEPLLQREPNEPRVRLMHGIPRAREGNARAAIAIFESLRNDRPDMFEPYNNLAVLYAKQGRLGDAREALLAALERRRDAVAYVNLGDVYMRLADRAYSRARDVGKDNGAPSKRSRRSGTVSRGSAKPVERSALGTTKGRSQRSDALPSSTPKLGPAKPASAASERPATRAEPSAAAAHDGPLVLVADPKEAGTAGSPKSAPAAASGGACVRAGKFKDRKAAAKAAAWMQTRGAELVDLRREKKRVVKSYRVYLPAFPSAEAASAKMAELRGRGVRDIAVMRKGTRINEISLGVFKSKSNTRRRIAELKKLGYSAKWGANTKILSEYIVRARPGSAGSALGSAWKSRFPGHSIGYVDCP